MVWVVALFLVTFILFAIPLMPAFIEMWHPTDVSPLRVVQLYDNNPMHFAEGFQKYIDSHFHEADSTTNRDGTLADGTDYKLVSNKGEVNLYSAVSTNKLIVSPFALSLPEEKIYDGEIYSEHNINTGKGSRFRALLAKATMLIGENSIILRWVHSDGPMYVGRGSTLLGRATSNDKIFISPGCTFERMHATKIVCGDEHSESIASPFIERTLLEELDGVKLRSGRRRLLENDLNFPARHTFDGDIVAGSTARIGDYAHIKGSIKSNAMNDMSHYLHVTGVLPSEVKGSARCSIGDYVQIDGAIVSTHDLYIGKHCRITGPVIAENLLVIRSGTVIGSPASPCTVTAPEIIIENGCVIYGSLWATKEGSVLDAQPDANEAVA